MNAKEKLLSAFFQLLTIKEFETISVSELCNVAKVHRSTFYAYYDNTYELLNDAKEKAMEELRRNLGTAREKVDYLSRDLLIKYLEFIKKYPNLFKAYLNNGDILDSDDLFDNIVNNYFIPEAKRNGHDDEQKIKLAILFSVKGMIGMQQYWLENGCQEAPETIADVFVNFLSTKTQS